MLFIHREAIYKRQRISTNQKKKKNKNQSRINQEKKSFLILQNVMNKGINVTIKMKQHKSNFLDHLHGPTIIRDKMPLFTRINFLF